jgi:hypothetical protein
MEGQLLKDCINGILKELENVLSCQSPVELSAHPLQ